MDSPYRGSLRYYLAVNHRTEFDKLELICHFQHIYISSLGGDGHYVF